MNPSRAQALRSLHILDRVLLQRLPLALRSSLIRASLSLAQRMLPRHRSRIVGLGSAAPTFRDVSAAMPEWLIHETEALRTDVDPGIPNATSIPPNPWHFWHPGRTGQGRAYLLASRSWPQTACRVIIVGTPDADAVQHANALADGYLSDVLMLVTDRSGIPSDVGGRVSWIDVSGLLEGLHTGERCIALAQLLAHHRTLDLKVHRSELGKILIQRHGKALAGLFPIRA